VDTARGNRQDAGHLAPVLVEEDAARAVFGDELVAHQVDPAERRRAVAFQLADDGARVQVVAAQQAKHLGQHAEVDAVLRDAVDHACMARWTCSSMPLSRHQLGQAVMRGPAERQVVAHDDRRADLLGELGALVHLLDVRRGDVEIVALALAGLGLGLLDGFLAELEAVAPAHEGLRVDVLVVLGEVETAAQRLIDGTAVVLGRQAELRLDGAAQERTAVFVQLVALDLDAVGRTGAGRDEPQREADVFEAQARTALKPNTLPTSEVKTLTTEPSSNRPIG
jgi:hypothetical protein